MAATGSPPSPPTLLQQYTAWKSLQEHPPGYHRGPEGQLSSNLAKAAPPRSWRDAYRRGGTPGRRREARSTRSRFAVWRSGRRKDAPAIALAKGYRRIPPVMAAAPASACGVPGSQPGVPSDRSFPPVSSPRPAEPAEAEPTLDGLRRLYEAESTRKEQLAQHISRRRFGPELSRQDEIRLQREAAIRASERRYGR